MRGQLLTQRQRSLRPLPTASLEGLLRDPGAGEGPGGTSGIRACSAWSPGLGVALLGPLLLETRSASQGGGKQNVQGALELGRVTCGSLPLRLPQSPGGLLPSAFQEGTRPRPVLLSSSCQLLAPGGSGPLHPLPPRWL